MSSVVPTSSYAGRAVLAQWPAAAAAPSHRLIVVSNRITSGGASNGGLAVALEAALKSSGGVWLGWSGEVTEKHKAPALVKTGAVTYAKLDLTRQDYEEYYAGFANRVLWPLFHFRTDLIDYRREHYAGYRRVNEMFAHRLAPLLQGDDIVWAHDYHLMLLGEALRREGVTQPLGFFFHTPFPPGELFRAAPPHAELMRAMCAYNLIGFQTENDRDGFLSYLEREPDCRVGISGGVVRAYGRELRVAVFPIGVDVDEIAEQAQSSVSSRHRQRLIESLRDRKLMVGVDRLHDSRVCRRGSSRSSGSSSSFRRRAGASPSSRSRRRRAPTCRNTPSYAARSRRRRATPTAATPSSTGRPCATSTRASTTAPSSDSCARRRSGW